MPANFAINFWRRCSQSSVGVLSLDFGSGFGSGFRLGFSFISLGFAAKKELKTGNNLRCAVEGDRADFSGSQTLLRDDGVAVTTALGFFAAVGVIGVVALVTGVGDCCADFDTEVWATYPVIAA